MLDCIDKSMIIEETINKRYDNIKFECLLDDGKIKVSCKKCNHSWPTSVRNAFISRVTTAVTKGKDTVWMK